MRTLLMMVVALAPLGFTQAQKSQIEESEYIEDDIVHYGTKIPSELSDLPVAVRVAGLDEISILPLSAADAISMDTIIVTETRNRDRKFDIPAKIEKLSGAQLENLSAVHPAEALNTVSGVHIHRGSGMEHLTSIRSPILTGGAGAGSFLYLQDGLPLRSAGFSNVNGLFEAHTELGAGLEIYKGPGSVLYGSNSLHGMVNTVSRMPDGKTRYRILAGEDGHASAAISHSNVSDQREGYIVNLALAHDNGFRDESGYDQQKLSIRVDEGLGDWDMIWQVSYQNLNQETAGFIRGDEAYRDDTLRFTNPNPEAYRDSRSVRSHIRLSKDVHRDDQLVIIPYARWTDMEFLRHFVPGQATEKVGHWSVGALNTYHGQNYLVGFDADFTSGYLEEFQAGPSVFSFVQGEHYDYDVDAVTLAAYGEYDLELNGRTDFSFGARAEYVNYTYDNKIDTIDVGRFRRVDDRSDDFFIITPKITLLRDLGDNLNGYVRAVRGARAPQVSDLYSLQTQQQPGEIKNETLDSVEIGIKKGFEDFNFEIAAYAMEKDNFFFRNSAGLNITNGKTSHRGLEVTVDWDMREWLAFSGNLNLARHTYNFDDAASSPSNTITDGDRVDTAPDVFGSAVLRVSPLEGLHTEIEWRHLGKYFLDPGNKQTYPGHDMFTLRGQYEFSDAATLFVRVDNLFDTRYANRADFAFGAERYFPGRPRTLFVGLRGEF
ncbi:MAG: TonB-dependent receptor [Hellea sp.]|nr:TonB-dependent receptor [Hellea sp.]